MKFFTVIFTIILTGLVTADTDCSPTQCLCETIFGRNAGDHEGVVFTCQDNPEGKDCLKICG